MHGKNLFYFFGGPGGEGAGGRSPPSPASPPHQQASPLRTASNSGSGQEGSAQAASDGLPDAAAGVVVMHVHFGMSGAFKTMSLPGPDPTETTRLELINRVRCRTGRCEWGGASYPVVVLQRRRLFPGWGGQSVLPVPGHTNTPSPDCAGTEATVVYGCLSRGARVGHSLW